MIFSTFKKVYSVQVEREEVFNSLSHGFTALGSVIGWIVLIVMGLISDKPWSLICAFIYGFCLVFLYGVSALYHGIRSLRLKEKMRIIDHGSIYLLIAGTYTPLVILTIGGTFGWTLFFIQWGLTLIGITLKIFYTGKYETLSLSMYLVMGWMIIFKVKFLYLTLPPTGFWLLVTGGIAYTAGIIFYLFDDKIHLAHFVWHLFVMTGSVLHYLLIIQYIIM